MQALPTSLNDKTQPWQKVIAGMLMIGAVLGVLYGCSLIINATFPSIIVALKNIWVLIGFGAPLTFLALYIYQNPWAIWNLFKTISWNITKFFIKLDPLSVMDRYVEYLKDKLSGLGEAISAVSGEQIKLMRKIRELNSKIDENAKLGNAAKKQGKMAEASTFGIKVKTDQSTLEMLNPLLDRADNSLKLMRALEENWGTQIEQISYQIQGKRAEYDIIKATYKGLKTAEDFINSDSEAAKNYGQSIIELENQVTAKMGYMEEFERKSKKIISSMDVEKQATIDEGLAELERYMQGDTLMLNITTLPESEVEYVPAQRKFNIGAQNSLTN